MPTSERIAFVQPFCPHYRVRTFEALARSHDVEFLFYSDGAEDYWIHDVGTGTFPHAYPKGRRVLGTVVSPDLMRRLARGWGLYAAQINGRFALPATFLAAKRARRPFVLWTGLWRHPQTLFHRLGEPVLRAIYRRSDAIVTYGPHVRRHLVEQGVAPERIFVTPHAADVPGVGHGTGEALRRSLGPGPIVLYLGRLVPEKGVDVLIEACRALERPARLVVAGTGTAAEALKRAAVGLDAVFPGYVDPADVGRWYAAADVVVVPSVTTARFREPWGLVVNEAFSLGKAVVASDAVGAVAGGLLRDGDTGLVVPEGDPASLAAAIDRLLGDPGLRGALGARGRAAVATHTHEAMAAGFGRAFDSLL